MNQDLRPFIAQYTTSTIDDHRGNPLIEALPVIKNDQQWLEQLLSLAAFDPSERHHDAYLRGYMVARLKDIFIPSDRHHALARRLDQVIRAGYRTRNPRSPEWKAKVHDLFAKAQAQGVAIRQVFGEARQICSYSVIGLSGMGKSTTTESILAAYPQHLLHTELNLHQIVWLKVDCPRDGSVKDLAVAILRAIDRVLGTEHAGRLPRNATAAVIMARVGHLLNVHSVGVLVLDEMQNLSVKRSGGREEMLNWFQELVNEHGVPIVLLGTPKARAVLGIDVRIARRSGIAGSTQWGPMASGQEFRLLLETLWEYQWLRQPGPLTEEMVDEMYRQTQGVNAFVVDMFLVAQLHALRSGCETLTPEIIKKVAQGEFAQLQPYLNALRSGDPRRLAKFEDALSYDIDELIAQEQRLITHGSKKEGEVPVGVSLVARVAANLRSVLGLDEARSRRFAHDAYDGTQKSATALTQAALRLAMAEGALGSQGEQASPGQFADTSRAPT